MALTAQVGLPVQYNIPQGTGPDQNTVYAATITAINADGTVNLNVMVDNGAGFPALNVPAKADGLTTFYSFIAFA